MTQEVLSVRVGRNPEICCSHVNLVCILDFQIGMVSWQVEIKREAGARNTQGRILDHG